MFVLLFSFKIQRNNIKSLSSVQKIRNSIKIINNKNKIRIIIILCFVVKKEEVLEMRKRLGL
jgi:hypothetical protein